ncbi:MAG TPA: PKD domain-containing protein [Baekduia sp.]|uniref:PKD domain-containing protein n=1 Tax=Baekduia sp. TaxID=2600305 RepID=UPI002C46A400|nr:PKD domain-containing protein [Baekduia sp.]HMJ33061.1 PKD domain-containing protein [Baekduia sp.]
MLKTRCAIVALLATASLALTAVAQATPATPTIAVQQTAALKARLTSSTGTHWSWTFLDAAKNVVGTSTVNGTVHAFPAAGDYTASVDATDDDPVLKAPAHAQATFHVYAKPVADFKYTVLANGTVQLAGASTGEPTGWNWTLPSGPFKDRTPPPQSFPAGTTNVTLKVTNPGGNSTITLPVVVNGPPVALLNVMSSPTGIGTPVLLDAGRSTDPNRDALTYSWDLNGDQVYRDGTGAQQSVSYPAPGSYRVGVQVSDGHGGVATATGFVTVLVDKPPVVSFTNAPQQPAVGAPVTFTATASDPDGTVARVEWDLDDDGQFDDAAGPTATWTFPAPGSRIVAVRATDDHGAPTIAFRTINVTAAPAVVPTTSVTEPLTGSSAPPPSPSSAPGPVPHAPAPSSTRPALMAPFPLVRIRGLIYHGTVRISLLKITAPRGATLRVRCHGRSCSGKRADLRVKVARAPVRLHALERRPLRPGTVIEVFITAPDRVGKYTRFQVRADAAPARSDLCLQPGAKTPTTCPTR